MYTVELDQAATPPQLLPVGPDGGALVGDEVEGVEEGAEPLPVQALTVPMGKFCISPSHHESV